MVEDDEGVVPDEVTGEPLTKSDFEELARFRLAIRTYLRVSEEIVRGYGLNPQQYQLLLFLKGYPGREWATIKELAELIQRRHHSVGELVDRAERKGFVRREPDTDDARVVRVTLTPEGDRLLARLSSLHRDELHRMGTAFEPPKWQQPR